MALFSLEGESEVMHYCPLAKGEETSDGIENINLLTDIDRKISIAIDIDQESQHP